MGCCLDHVRIPHYGCRVAAHTTCNRCVCVRVYVRFCVGGGGGAYRVPEQAAVKSSRSVAAGEKRDSLLSAKFAHVRMRVCVRACVRECDDIFLPPPSVPAREPLEVKHTHTRIHTHRFWRRRRQRRGRKCWRAGRSSKSVLYVPPLHSPPAPPIPPTTE